MNVPIGFMIVAMAKTMIVDPPYVQKQKNVKTDWWGLIFLIMFAVAFEIMMDKANDEDWFNSVFICRLTVIWVIGLIGFIISQIKGKDTLVRFNVLRNWNFTMGTLCITVMNAVLLGSLAMIPQFMQNMMGYDAYTSGLSMMPRGIGCLIGLLLNKYLTETNDVYVAKLGAYTANFAQNTDLSTAGYMAQKLTYNELLQQSRLWAYIDSFRIYAVVSLGIILLIFLMKNSKS